MKKKEKILIFGTGSSAKRYYKILVNFFEKENIYFFSERKINFKNKILNKNNFDNIDFKFFFICSITSNHIKHLKLIENNFRNKIVLVEKPLFEKYYKSKKYKNKIYVGYHLRFNPLVQYIKQKISKFPFLYSHFECSSYLPGWRKRDYKKSYSSDSIKGGGVLLDVSHELDLMHFFFGKLDLLSSFSRKISNLKISSDDIFYGKFIINKKKLCTCYLNYFSKNIRRKFYFENDSYFIQVDLIKNEVIEKKNDILKKKIKFVSSKENETKLLIEDLLNKRKIICTLREGLKINKLIDKAKLF